MTINPTLQGPLPRDGILDIAPYIPGKSKTHKFSGELHKLSSNESALGPSPEAIKAYEAASRDLHLYPDGSAMKLRETIAHQHGLESDRIVCGAGSDELLQLLCKAYLGEGDNIVQSEHGFLVYAIAAKSCGAETYYAPEKNLCADVETILDCVNERTKIVFLANPNNPTGTYLSQTELERLHAGLRKDTLLVIDAAYAEYVITDDYNSGENLVRKSNNVVMTRTFSKIYGLGGLRLGWAYCPPPIADVLNRIRGPFNISAAAQHAGIAALKDQAFVERNRQHNKTEREVMRQRLNGMGLVCQPSQGNFLLVEFPQIPGQNATDILQYLEEHGLIVRDMTAYQLPHHLRISIGNEKANRRALDLLAEKFSI